MNTKIRNLKKHIYRTTALLIVLFTSGQSVRAASYVFMKDGGYMAVENGTLSLTSEFSLSCVWTCVSNTTTLAAATLDSSTSQFLYTTYNGQTYWLYIPNLSSGRNSNGIPISVSTTKPSSSYWRMDRHGNDLWLYAYIRNLLLLQPFYAYYKDSVWRLSEDENGTTGYGDDIVKSYSVTITDVPAITTITTPTISPSGATIAYNSSQQFNAPVTAETSPGYSTYVFNSNTFYYYNNTLYSSESAMKSSSEWIAANAVPQVSYTWTLTGDDNIFLTPHSSDESTITITHSTMAWTDASSTLNVTVSATANGKTASASANAVTISIPDSRPFINPTAITANDADLVVGQTMSYTDYTLTPADNHATKTYNYVSASSSDPDIATVSNNSGSFTITGVADGETTITIYAYQTDNSTVSCSTTFIVQVSSEVTGVAGDKVILFDYEDHNWSYYSDPDCPIHSLNPSDIKITYYGNGTGTVTAATSLEAIDEPESFSLDATGVQVGVEQGETQNTFVYYKTLERQNPETGEGYLEYTTIPNPFQVRPLGESATIISPTRNVYISGRSQGNSGIIQVNYINKYGNPDTWSNSSGNTVNATIAVKSGTKITLFAKGRRQTDFVGWFYDYSEITAKYDNNSGQEIVSVINSQSDYSNGVSKESTNPVNGIETSYSSYRGFYAWRVKECSSNLIIIDADDNDKHYGVNAIIPAEKKLLFSTNESTGESVVFEALWAQAYVATGSSTITTPVPATVTSAYERNFQVVNTSIQASSIQKTYPCTVIGRNPSSTTNNATRTISGNFTATADTKFEDVTFNASSNTFTANGHHLIVGRGCNINNSSTVGTIRGRDGGGSNDKYTIRLESGTFNNLHLYTNATQTVTASGVVELKAIIGCDYDRANKNNNNLTIAPSTNGINYVYGSLGVNGNDIYGVQFTSQNNINSMTFDWYIKSGTIHKDVETSNGNGDLTLYMGHPTGTNQAQYLGKRRLTMEGGVLAGISGGVANSADGYDSYLPTDGPALEIRIKGGTVRHSVYGAGEYGGSSGDRRFIFTGGEIKGWLAGGCNGTRSNGGVLYGDVEMYLGGNFSMGTDSVGGTNTYGNTGAQGGNVFGAGCGILPSSSTTAFKKNTVGEVNSTTIAIADNAYIPNNVYGGGNYGSVADNGFSKIYILGGTVDGKVFGGSNKQKGQSVDIVMRGGQVKGGVYGGSNLWGYINGDITVKVEGGTIGVDEDHTANVHGGGYGENTITFGNVDVTIGSATLSPTIYGDVYGGSALGSVNGGSITESSSDVTLNASYESTQHTNVTVINGTILGNGPIDLGNNAKEGTGSVYGGGLGSASVASNVYGGSVQVTVNNGSINNVFGCNNRNGSPQGEVTVIINGTEASVTNGNNKTYAIQNVYGGGNVAHYNPNTTGNFPTVTVNGCQSSIEDVFGGGKAAAVPYTYVTINGGDIDRVFAGGDGENSSDTPAHVGYMNTDTNPSGAGYGTGTASVYIYGGTVNQVFGGVNKNGIIRDAMSVVVEKGADCNEDMIIDEVYGGGNMAASNAGSITIGCMDDNDIINYVYGGARAADVAGDIELTINGGHINNVFGGNNIDGEVEGSITVNVDWSRNSTCDNYLGNVYGGGNLASYTAPTTSPYTGLYPEVNIIDGTVSGNVFGGGKGSTAVVDGNPAVTVGDNNPNHTVVIDGNVFGGGEAADVKGSITIDILAGTINQDVYGGGALANTNTSNATDYGTNVETLSSTSTYTTTVNLKGGSIRDVYGGGLGQKPGYNGASIDESDVPAYVYGDVTVNLNEGVADDGKGCIVERIFGCNNVNGTPLGATTVHVYKTQNEESTRITNGGGVEDAKEYDRYDVAAVYGGGNLASYSPVKADSNNDSEQEQAHTNVIIDGCDRTSIEYVYGGGNAAPVPASIVTVNGAYEIGYVFGGGNGKDDILVNGVLQSNPGANIGFKDDGFTSSGTGTTTVELYGGKIHEAFGGSNTLGNVRVSSNVFLEQADETCPIEVDEVYGGGNHAPQDGTTNLTMGCIPYMAQIYGGSKQANINNGIELTITSGGFGKVFGGNNLGGTINGPIEINIEQTGCLPIEIDELYLGGNHAGYSVFGYKYDNGTLVPRTNAQDGEDYTEPSAVSQLYDDPVINIKSAKRISTVFGGGLEAILVGNPTINVNMVEGWITGEYNGTISSQYNIKDGTDNPVMTFLKEISGETEIGTIGTIFGGGNEGDVIGHTTVYIGTEQIVTLKSVDSASDVPASPGNHGITISGTTVSAEVKGATITGNVYGGGNAAAVTDGTNVVVGREPANPSSPSPAPQRTTPALQPDNAAGANAANGAGAGTTNGAASGGANGAGESDGGTRNATESQQTRTITPTRL